MYTTTSVDNNASSITFNSDKITYSVLNKSTYSTMCRSTVVPCTC